MNLGMKLFVAAHVKLYRASHGKLGATLGGQPVILLTTRGRKSGLERTVPIIPYIEGDAIYVMASMGGQPKHPAWFLNLQGNPEATVQRGAEQFAVRAHVVEGDERARLWALITAAMPNFAAYQAKTTRVIPVIELRRTH